MTKIWRDYPDECDICGCNTEIFTEDYFHEGWACDGDSVRCVGCGAIGHLNVYDYDDCWVNWYDE